MSKKRSTRKETSPNPAEQFPWIAEPLRPLAEPIDGLELDPQNPRKHDEPNLKAIRTCLHRFGQRKPIVVNRKNNQVEAGNGTLLAARALGWSHLAVVWVEDDEAAQTGFSIADNRTAELANWDNVLLAELLEKHAADAPDLYDDLLMAALFDEASKPAAGKTKPEGVAEPMPDTWCVVVDCRDEDDQKAFYETMKKEGRTCRLLTL